MCKNGHFPYQKLFTDIFISRKIFLFAIIIIIIIIIISFRPLFHFIFDKTVLAQFQNKTLYDFTELVCGAGIVFFFFLVAPPKDIRHTKVVTKCYMLDKKKSNKIK